MDQEIAAGAIKTAMDLIGTDYVHGGKDPKTGLDCSGLTKKAYPQLPHGATNQYNYCKENDYLVDPSQGQAGDVIFMDGGTHTAIYGGEQTVNLDEDVGKKMEKIYGKNEETGQPNLKGLTKNLDGTYTYTGKTAISSSSGFDEVVVYPYEYINDNVDGFGRPRQI